MFVLDDVKQENSNVHMIDTALTNLENAIVAMGRHDLISG